MRDQRTLRLVFVVAVTAILGVHALLPGRSDQPSQLGGPVQPPPVATVRPSADLFASATVAALSDAEASRDGVAQSAERRPVKPEGADSNSAVIAIPTATVLISALSPPLATPIPVYSSPAVVPHAAGLDARFASALAASAWPSSLYGVVVCIARRESGFDPGAIGGAGERGYLQIHPTMIADLEAHGYTWDQMFDPVANLDYGYSVFGRYGLGPWGGAC